MVEAKTKRTSKIAIAAPPSRPLLIGLTGSIGMGKTETAKLFARLGIPVYDADAAVHALYQQGGAAVGPIAKAFPGTLRDGRIDRNLLLRRVANDDAAFRRLEKIVHPLVAEAQNAFLAGVARAQAPLAVLDIPLLFETGGEKRVDVVVVVLAPREVQRDRVLARPGMTLEKLEAIRLRQIPDAEKRAKADFVVETDKGLEHAFAHVKRIVASLRERAGQAAERGQARGKGKPKARHA